MKRLMISLGLMVCLAASALAQADAKAQDVIKKARAAIGKEDKLKGLQNVVAEVNFKRSFGQFNQEGTIELVMAGQDKVYQATSSVQGGNENIDIQVLNVDKTWTDRIAGMGGGGGFGGGGAGRGPGGPGGFLDPATQEKNRRNGLARVLLGFFLTAPGVDYVYAGEAKAPDGTVADIVQAKAADGPVAKLYIDRTSSQLLMLSYKDKDMRSLMRGGRPPGQGGPGGAPPAPGAPGAQAGGQNNQQNNQQRIQEELAKLPPAERAKREAEIAAQRETRMAEMKALYDKAPEIDFRWSFAEYKSEGGLNLPHLITRSQGQDPPNEEWVIAKYKFNDKKVTPEKFEKKTK